LVAGGLEPFAPGAAFESCFLFSRLSAMRLSSEKFVPHGQRVSVQVFAEADIQYPVQFVFDAPVLAHDRVQPRRIRPETGDVIAGLTLDFAGDL